MIVSRASKVLIDDVRFAVAIGNSFINMLAVADEPPPPQPISDDAVGVFIAWWRARRTNSKLTVTTFLPSPVPGPRT